MAAMDGTPEPLNIRVGQAIFCRPVRPPVSSPARPTEYSLFSAGRVAGDQDYTLNPFLTLATTSCGTRGGGIELVLSVPL